MSITFYYTFYNIKGLKKFYLMSANIGNHKKMNYVEFHEGIYPTIIPQYSKIIQNQMLLFSG